MFLKCHAPICLVVGVSPLCSMMQQMVRKLHVQQCSKDCRWFGDDWGKIGRGHKFSIVSMQNSLTVEFTHCLV